MSAPQGKLETRKLPPVPYGALFFAPMEGITEEPFRKTILKLYPDWDYLACDFLRVPSAGRYPVKHLVRHMGHDLFQLPWVKEKTMYQILTSHKAFTAQMVQDLNELNIPWLDLNLGCPSSTVCGNKGGSYLLQDLKTLRPLVKTIRENFKGRMSVKIRTGFDDTRGFDDSIRLLNDEGAELITVHGRTRAQMYKEPANWKYIRRAVEISQVPVIGNGDVWQAEDIERMFNETGCHGVMVARGALRSPWVAANYRWRRYEESSPERSQKIREFFTEFRSQLEASGITQIGLLKLSKALGKFMLQDNEQIRRRLLLSQTTPEFYSVIEQL